jgi:hypothetical protein
METDHTPKDGRVRKNLPRREVHPEVVPLEADLAPASSSSSNPRPSPDPKLDLADRQ